MFVTGSNAPVFNAAGGVWSDAGKVIRVRRGAQNGAAAGRVMNARNRAATVVNWTVNWDRVTLPLTVVIG